VTGERDGYAPPAALESLRAQAPRCALEVIPEADHFFQTGLSGVSRSGAGWLTG
jgi:hypothetical protein